jgi:hypothetical protein
MTSALAHSIFSGISLGKQMGKAPKNQINDDLPQPQNRRNFLSKTALLGLSGVAVSLGLAGCKKDTHVSKPAAPA